MTKNYCWHVSEMYEHETFVTNDRRVAQRALEGTDEHAESVRALNVTYTKFAFNEPLDDDEAPKWITPHLPTKETPDCRKVWAKNPHVFNSSQWIYLSKRFVDVLSDFNLGQTRLHKIRLLDVDHKTELADPYYLLNVAEFKDTWDIERSQNLTPDMNTEGLYCVLPDTKNDQNQCTSAALEGVDMWVEKRQSRAPTDFMISDALYKALKKAKLTSRLRYVRFTIG